MTLEQARRRAEKFFKQEERHREGNAAMAEYQANAIKVREKIARLRTLRLGKEAEAHHSSK